MEYIFIFLFLASTFLAYWIMKIKISFGHKVLCNISLLLVSAIWMVLTRIQEGTLLIYILILLFTSMGILMRLTAPIVLNCTGRILSKLQKQSYEQQSYEPKSYEQWMQDGHKMFFCVLLFTTMKVLLYMLLVMSAFELI